jgi:hypothetical protein
MSFGRLSLEWQLWKQMYPRALAFPKISMSDLFQIQVNKQVPNMKHPKRLPLQSGVLTSEIEFDG